MAAEQAAAMPAVKINFVLELEFVLELDMVRLFECYVNVNVWVGASAKRWYIRVSKLDFVEKRLGNL